MAKRGSGCGHPAHAWHSWSRSEVGGLDGGLEIGHEDLVDNIVAGGSHNFLNGSNDPTPPADEIDNDHGTAVADIIAARGWNGLGGRGVAPEAKVAGFNAISILDGSKQYVDIRYSWGDGPEARAMDVFNNRFGISTAVYPFSDLDEQRSLEKMTRARVVARAASTSRELAMISTRCSMWMHRAS